MNDVESAQRYDYCKEMAKDLGLLLTLESDENGKTYFQLKHPSVERTSQQWTCLDMLFAFLVGVRYAKNIEGEKTLDTDMRVAPERYTYKVYTTKDPIRMQTEHYIMRRPVAELPDSLTIDIFVHIDMQKWTKHKVDAWMSTYEADAQRLVDRLNNGESI